MTKFLRSRAEEAAEDAAEFNRLRADNERLREKLRPFSDEAANASADNERLRLAVASWKREAEDNEREVEVLRSLLREAYDGRQKPMTVGLCYRIGHTLNHGAL